MQNAWNVLSIWAIDKSDPDAEDAILRADTQQSGVRKMSLDYVI